MAVQSNQQKAKFDQRLDRIKGGGPNTVGQVYIGPGDTSQVSVKQKKHFGIVATLSAFMLGAVSFFAGDRFSNSYLADQTTLFEHQLGTNWGTILADNSGLLVATLALLALLMLLRRPGLGPIFVGAIGLVAMYLGQPFLADQFPSVFLAL